jgi:uncharacterized protein YqcC (DUF446 family)
VTRQDNNKHVAVAALLIDIEAELRMLGWWESQPPSPDAMRSTMPFHADTLAFNQWVQFVFLPRMHELIEQRLPLPGACGIAPMLEEFGRVSGRTSQRLLQLFADVDALLTGASA